MCTCKLALTGSIAINPVLTGSIAINPVLTGSIAINPVLTGPMLFMLHVCVLVGSIEINTLFRFSLAFFPFWERNLPQWPATYVEPTLNGWGLMVFHLP
jgi:hypothetical protein